MAFDDLRSFLQALDEQGQLLKIEEEVNAEPDLAAAANATGRIGDGAPALWFVVLFLFLRASSASTSFVRRTSTRRAAISLRSARISVSWTSSTRPIRRLML